MHKILIPTDFSNNALQAIAYATEIFKHGPAQIFLLHAYADEVYDAKTFEKDTVFEELKEQVCKKTDHALEALKRRVFQFSPNPKHEIHCMSKFGLLVDEVNYWVEKENIDVVVMGTKGQTSDKKLTFGSNTLQIIKYVKCPVLAVPEGYKMAYPKNILFSTDLLLPYKRREMKLLASLAKRFAAKIHFLHVSRFETLSLRQQDNKDFLVDIFDENHVEYHRIPGDNVTETVNAFLSENNVDILVMVNTRHSYLENMMYQSTIERIGLHIDIPFLVMQNLPR